MVYPRHSVQCSPFRSPAQTQRRNPVRLLVARHLVHSRAKRAKLVLLEADVREDLGLVVDPRGRHCPLSTSRHWSFTSARLSGTCKSAISVLWRVHCADMDHQVSPVDETGQAAMEFSDRNSDEPHQHADSEEEVNENGKTDRDRDTRRAQTNAKENARYAGDEQTCFTEQPVARQIRSSGTGSSALSHLMDSYQEATEEDTGGREHVVLFFGIVRSRQRRQAPRRDAQLITNKRFHQAHQHHCAQTASVYDVALDPSQRQQLLGLSAAADLHLHPPDTAKRATKESSQKDDFDGLTARRCAQTQRHGRRGVESRCAVSSARSLRSLCSEGITSPSRAQAARVCEPLPRTGTTWPCGAIRRDVTYFARPSGRDMFVFHRRAITRRAYRRRSLRNE